MGMGDFMPLLEESGLRRAAMVAVLREAMEQDRKYQTAQLKAMRQAVAAGVLDAFRRMR